MMHLSPLLREQYRIEDLGELEGTKGINLSEHVGLWRSDAPAFGSPLIHYEETELEKYQKVMGNTHNTWDERNNAKYALAEFGRNQHFINWNTCRKNIEPMRR